MAERSTALSRALRHSLSSSASHDISGAFRRLVVEFASGTAAAFGSWALRAGRTVAAVPGRRRAAVGGRAAECGRLGMRTPSDAADDVRPLLAPLGGRGVFTGCDGARVVEAAALAPRRARMASSIAADGSASKRPALSWACTSSETSRLSSMRPTIESSPTVARWGQAMLNPARFLSLPTAEGTSQPTTRLRGLKSTAHDN